MKKAILSIAVLLSYALASMAIPAYPKPIQVTQPDGSVVTIQLHGDEFSHYATINGIRVSQSPEGFWVPSPQTKTTTVEKMTRQNAAGPRMAFTKGEARGLIMLVDFADLKMGRTNQEFHDLLNKDGYTANGATGSAAEYFRENSNGLYRPTFDVVGPVTLSKKAASYGDTSEHTAAGFIEACKIAHEKGLVDFSKYDNDKDGNVDYVFFYFAGHNEAEGASEDTIWPHAWFLQGGGDAPTYDGVKINRYACTSEYRGSEDYGASPCGIGTFCHEFSHVLGLPDFYDTDYADNGEGDAVYNFSLMCQGSYNNAGRTPPYMNVVERNLLGWAEGPVLWKTSGDKVIEPVYKNVAYYTTTASDGEIFIYEARDGSRWDKYIAKGMLVYHLDASRRTVGGTTAKSRWEYGDGINDYGDHQCYYIVSAKPNPKAYDQIPFPGSSVVRSFDASTNPASKDWDGNDTGFHLYNIRTVGSNVELTLDLDKSKKVKGTVYDTSGEPIPGATVSLAINADTKVTRKGGVAAMKMFATKEGSTYYTTVGDDGSYEFDLTEEQATDFVLTVSCRGFFGQRENVQVAAGTISRDFKLQSINYTGISETKKYKFTALNEIYGVTLGEGNDDVYISLYFSPEQLADLAGARVDSILFAVSKGNESDPITVKETSVVVDVESRKTNLITKVVDKTNFGGWTRCGFPDKNITVPSGKGMYFGYRLSGIKGTGYPFLCTDEHADDGCFCYTVPGYDWASNDDYTALIIVCFTKMERTLDTAGINAINNPGAGRYKVGDRFTLSLLESAKNTPSSVAWSVDGSPTSESSIVLSEGEHLIEAILSFADGTTETLQQYILAQ